jgi:hypothetical protein
VLSVSASRSTRSSSRPGVATRISVPLERRLICGLIETPPTTDVTRSFEPLTKGDQVFRDLVHQLARRGQDQGLRAPGRRSLRIGQQPLDQRQAESRGFSRSGLGQAHQILAFEDVGNCVFLNRSRRFVAVRFNGLQKLMGKAERLKVCQFISFVGPCRRTGGIKAPLLASACASFIHAVRGTARMALAESVVSGRIPVRFSNNNKTRRKGFLSIRRALCAAPLHLQRPAAHSSRGDQCVLHIGLNRRKVKRNRAERKVNQGRP